MNIFFSDLHPGCLNLQVEDCYPQLYCSIYNVLFNYFVFILFIISSSLAVTDTLTENRYYVISIRTHLGKKTHVLH